MAGFHAGFRRMPVELFYLTSMHRLEIARRRVDGDMSRGRAVIEKGL
jgi:hypothetical protein